MEEVYMGEDYSDVPWETGETKASSSTSPVRSSISPTLTTFALNATDALKITVTDPQKHGEGSGAFVTYAVNTRTILDTYPRPEMSTRRRFQDFVWLHRSLGEEYPACIVPPLPGKHRMEYITGDRFSPEFIEKRRLSLQTYLDRVSRHPTLQRSAVLKKFLDTGDLQIVEAASRNRDSHVLENISDVFLNAFAKVRKPDQQFLEFKENVEKFEENLTTVEKLHTKLLKQHADLERDTAEFEGCITTLGVMETQVTGPLTEFGNTVREICTLLKDKSQREEVDFVGSLREYIAYCHSVKEVLKLRDQKQVDHEELQTYLENSVSDRERTMSGRGSGGITSFIKEKYNDFRNINHEQARQAKLARLEAKIAELTEAVEQSHDISTAFSNEVAKELELFQSVKVADFKDILRDYTESQMEYFQKGLRVWEDIIPVLQNIEIEEPAAE
ncbi:hypothetical protein, variant [Spizellomyces punctatus DAOM BR117]|uniref:Sorting nexin-4 n=1 Tax=Spizellomyces punctatus (strain DAOM BR117) TaxID=645134 RepID=A0A0L0HTG6_SPIPD|nr:hypothetical protein, variant [Spizellomyces punctatus DAOM BR117]KND04159.1 hypothetical protein, variant [Spizellomyces punctatus DAOM BR117]|eukprot:XP_016612198.1 hypothetical protein, variant [Spizellomyces punctatus DAOM BR117]